MSSTHAVVGSVVAFAIAGGHGGAIKWDHLESIAVSWVVSPLLGGLLSYLLYWLIKRSVVMHTCGLKRR